MTTAHIKARTTRSPCCHRVETTKHLHANHPIHLRLEQHPTLDFVNPRSNPRYLKAAYDDQAQTFARTHLFEVE